MKLFTKWAYQRVSSRDQGKAEDDVPGDHGKDKIWQLIAFLAMLVAILLAVTLVPFVLGQRALNVVQRLPERPCGQSPEEALANGCIFDVMMDSWLAPDCYDDELTQEFRQTKDWKFVEWENTTHSLDEDGLSRSSRAKTTLQYHVAHCAFALRKLHRAIAQDRQIEVAVASVGHTDHCAAMFQKMVWRQEIVHRNHIDSFSIEQIGTRLHPAFPECMYARDI